MRRDSVTLYVDSNSRLHTCHPCTKLAYVLLTGVVVYCAPGGWVPDVALIVLNVLLAVSSGVAGPVWRASWRFLLPLALFMVPIHGFLYPGNETAVYSLGKLVLYREGLLFAVTVLVQLSALLTASLLFVFTTHPADLITSLTQAGWSPSAAYVVGGPLLMLPAMRGRIRAIQDAQRSRGLESEGSFLTRVRSIAPLVTPLVLGAFMEIEQRAIALELRGFSLPGLRTSLRVVPDSGAQRLLRWSMLIVSLLLFAANLMFMG